MFIAVFKFHNRSFLSYYLKNTQKHEMLNFYEYFDISWQNNYKFLICDILNFDIKHDDLQ